MDLEEPEKSGLVEPCCMSGVPETFYLVKQFYQLVSYILKSIVSGIRKAVKKVLGCVLMLGAKGAGRGRSFVRVDSVLVGF